MKALEMKVDAMKGQMDLVLTTSPVSSVTIPSQTVPAGQPQQAAEDRAQQTSNPSSGRSSASASSAAGIATAIAQKRIVNTKRRVPTSRIG